MLEQVGARHIRWIVQPKNQNAPSLPQTRMKQDDVKLYTSVENKSSTTLPQCSMESYTIDSSSLACMRQLSAAK